MKLDGTECLRAFLAAGITEEIRNAAARLLADGRRSVSGIKWVEPANLHLTVKFLGQTPAGTLDRAAGPLSEVLASIESFEASFRCLGAFPSPRRPRVLFAEMEAGKGEMGGLILAVEKTLGGLGFPREERPPSPHLTLGRVRREGGVLGVPEWMELNREIFLGRCRVEEIVLMKSQLRPSGPVYTPLRIFRLGRAASGEVTPGGAGPAG